MNSPTGQERSFQEHTLPEPRLGHDRLWYWRGWRIRYTYLRPQTPVPHPIPLLLVHGFGSSLIHWRQNLQPLSQTHPVYALDLLGFGASQKTGAPYSPLFFAELLADFGQLIIQRPAIFIGNSLGSVISLTAAHRYPDRVKGLVLINLPDASVCAKTLPPPTSPSPRLLRWGQTLLTAIFTSPLVINPLLAIVRSPAMVYSALRSGYEDPRWVDAELQASIGDPAHDRYAALTLRCLTRGMGNVAPSDRARSILPTLKTPLLLIWGKNDRIVPPFLAPRCAALNPQIHLVEMEGVGHFPQDECSDRVNLLIQNWIEENIV